MSASYQINVDQYLSHSAATYPDKVAIVDHNGQRTTTFAQLNELAQRLGGYLLSINLSRQPILLILPKSMEALACFAGVTKSNNFYTIFDESTPIERLLKVIKIFKPKLVITHQDYSHLEKLKHLTAQVLDSIQNPLSKNAALVSAQASDKTSNQDSSDRTAQTEAESLAFLSVEQLPHLPLYPELLAKAQAEHIDVDLLYVLFTSGSTGEPKGVTITHRSVIDYIEWLTPEFSISQDTVFLNQAPFYFDNSIFDIYSTFKASATLHLIDSLWFTFPAKVCKYMHEHAINFIFWVPSVLCFFANTAAIERYAPQLNALRHVAFCGEQMPCKQLNLWRKYLPQCSYSNLYGPTEITDVCACYHVQREFADDEVLPIGKACANTQLLVFEPTCDHSYRLITPDMPGHKGLLFVRGLSLSLGYYANQEKSQEVFIQNPLHHNYLDRVYNTGDIVAYNEHGELVCFGRSDSQIKYKGHRIELGEIEAVVRGHPQVQNCACVFEQQIGLFYSSKQPLDLKAYLNDKLPYYMIPTQLEHVEQFKLNANGKIDRLELKAKLQELLAN